MIATIFAQTKHRIKCNRRDFILGRLLQQPICGVFNYWKVRFFTLAEPMPEIARGCPELLQQPTKQPIHVSGGDKTLDQLGTFAVEAEATISIGDIDGSEDIEEIINAEMGGKQAFDSVPYHRVRERRAVCLDMVRVTPFEGVVGGGHERMAGEKLI